MTREESLVQAHVELDPAHNAAVTTRADELYTDQIAVLEAELAAERAATDAKQATLDSLKAEMAETPAEESTETAAQEGAEG